jgi:hypothetical protein
MEADPELGGRTPDALGHEQKLRLGATNSSKGQKVALIDYSNSASVWMRLFLLTSPNLFLIDPLSPIEVYNRAAITRIEVVFIWFCVYLFVIIFEQITFK